MNGCERSESLKSDKNNMVLFNHSIRNSAHGMGATMVFIFGGSRPLEHVIEVEHLRFCTSYGHRRYNGDEENVRKTRPDLSS